MNKNLALIYLLLFCNFSFAQNIYSGFITSSENNKPIKGVEIYNKIGGELSQTDKNGFFKFNSSEKDLTIILFARNFNVLEQKIISNEKINIQLRPLSRELMEVEVKSRKQKIFELKRLSDVEGTSIFAGKKNEVVFRSTDTSFVWGGTGLYQDKQPEGSYVYYIIGKNKAGDPIKKHGFLFLKR